MTAREIGRTLVYYVVVGAAAACAATVAPIPFTGVASNGVGILAAAGVCLVGIACAPRLPQWEARS